MKKVNIYEDFMIGVNFKYEEIKTFLEKYEDVIVICFENNFSNENYYIELLNETWVKKVILIGANPTSCFGEKLIVTSKIKEKFLKGGKKVFFIINTDIDEDVLIPMVKTFDFAYKNEVEVGIDNLIGVSYKHSAILEISIKALLQENYYKRYEIVYDYICDQLDKKFADNSICQFEGDRCIANRKYYNKDKIMGCCYSFKYNGFKFSDIKLCIHQKNQSCDVKCLGCKLFTCEYLKKHGIRFSLNNMPIALAFFSKKQREILRTTFFTTKEDVLSQVMKSK